jgi:hypothetical protein
MRQFAPEKEIPSSGQMIAAHPFSIGQNINSVGRNSVEPQPSKINLCAEYEEVYSVSEYFGVNLPQSFYGSTESHPTRM